MLRSKSALGCAIAPLLAAGCGAAPSAAPASTAAHVPVASSAAPTPATAPIDIAAMAGREIPPGPKVPLQAGEYSGQIETTATPDVDVKPDHTTIAFSFGSEAKVQCVVYAHEIDPAASLASVLRSIQGDKISVRRIMPYAVVAAGEEPALFVEATYVASQPGGDAAGMFKIAAIDSLTAPLVCFHDELGYGETFKRVTTELASSLRSANPPPPLKYVALWSARIGTVPVGFGRELAGVDDEKHPFFLESSAYFIPASATEFVAGDMIKHETEDGRGGLVEIRYASGDGTDSGEKSAIVKRVGTQEYTYEATDKGGKKLSGKFKTKGARGLRSQSERVAALRDLVAGKPQSGLAHVEQYSPETTMTGPVDTLYRLLAKADRKVEESSNGEIVWTGTIDDKGLNENGEVPGKTTLTIERLVVRGAP